MRKNANFNLKETIHWIMIIVFFLCVYFLASSCTTFKPIGVRAFGLLGEISKKQIEQLLLQNGSIWAKDSINITANVPRSKCRKILGTRLNKWVTSKGQASLDKKDLYAHLSWEVLQDTSKVRMNFIRVVKK